MTKGSKFESREDQEFSLLHVIQTGFGVHLTSYPMGSRCSFPGGKSGRGMKLTTHFHPLPRSRKVDLYIHSPICLHGVVLNLLSTGTTPFFIEEELELLELYFQPCMISYYGSLITNCCTLLSERYSLYRMCGDENTGCCQQYKLLDYLLSAVLKHKLIESVREAPFKSTLQ
jgi:hypothetical protein